ncbi:MAG: pilin [Patescibacteria group bacterium]
MILRILLALAMLPSTAFALVWQPRWDKFRNPIAGVGAGSGTNFLNDLADGWYNFLFGLVMGTCVIAVIWGASTMQGTAIDEGNKENGKKIIVGALTGLVLAILAAGIVNFADGFLDATNFPACPNGAGPGCP